LIRLHWICASLLLAVLPALQAAARPSEVLEEFHGALRTNRPDAVLQILAKDAVIYEQGFAETSRDEWARNQLGNAIAFARDTKRRVVRSEAGESGDAAWVISTTQTMLDVSDRKVMLEGAETAILRRVGSDWKIAHLHWSAHEASEEDTARAVLDKSDPASAKAPAKRSRNAVSDPKKKKP